VSPDFAQGPAWLAWAEQYVRSEAYKRLLTLRWVTADEAVFRFGIPRYHVTELTHRWGSPHVEWDFGPWPGMEADDMPRLDARKFSRVRGLKAKQNTFVARQLQRHWGLSHILPSAWDRVNDDTFFP
jgi:hypothetical protein